MSKNQEDTKNKILTAAIELFALEGIEQTGVRKVCNQANMATAAIAYHFGNKENLINHCIKHCFKRINDHIVFLDQTLKTTPATFATTFAIDMEKFENEIRLLFTYFCSGKLSSIPEATSMRDNFINAITKRNFEVENIHINAEAFFYAIFNDQLSRIFELNRTSSQRTLWLSHLAKTLFSKS